MCFCGSFHGPTFEETFIRSLRLTFFMSRLEEPFKLLQASELRRDLLKLEVHGIVSRSGVDRTDHQTFELQLWQAADLLLQTWQDRKE